MSLPPKLTALAAAQGGPFTTAQALAAGYDDREIHRFTRSGEWVRLRRGVYAEAWLVPTDPTSRHVLQLRAVLLALQHAPAASHVTSAALHGIALLDPDYSLVHVTRENAGSSRTGGGVRHHDASLPESHLTKLDDVLATSAARTVVDLARILGFDAAVVAAESALNKEFTNRPELCEVLAYCVDWPGAKAAGRVVSIASPYSESPGESIGRIAFDALGIPQPDQQVLLYDEAGFIGRCDYYWKAHHTVGEFDGRLKYVGDNVPDDVLAKEKAREDRLRRAGAEVVRYGWAESRAKSPSMRRKTFDAFKRAADRPSPRSLRYELPPERA